MTRREEACEMQAVMFTIAVHACYFIDLKLLCASGMKASGHALSAGRHANAELLPPRRPSLNQQGNDDYSHGRDAALRRRSSRATHEYDTNEAHGNGQRRPHSSRDKKRSKDKDKHRRHRRHRHGSEEAAGQGRR